MNIENESIKIIKEQHKLKKIFKRIFKFMLLFFLFSTILLTVASIVITKVYKSEIKSFVITKVEDAIKADIGVGKIDLSIIEKFPKVSLSFSNFDIVSSFQNKKDTLVIGKKLFFEFDIIDVLQHNYQVTSLSFEEAKVDFKINKQGVSNFDIFKAQSTSDSSKSMLLSLQNFQFKNIDVIYNDDKQNIHLNTSVNSARFKGDFNDVELAIEVYSDFKLRKFTSGDFVVIDKNITYDGVFNLDKLNNVYHLSNNKLSISGLELLVNGDVDYSFQDKMNLNLSCYSNKIDISSLALINQEFYTEFIAPYKPNGTLNLDASLIGFASISEFPSLNLGFNISDADFQLFELPFHELNLEGILQLDENIKQVKVLSSKMKFNNDYIELNGLYSFKDLQQVKFDVNTNLSAVSSSSIFDKFMTDSLFFSFNGESLIDVKADLNILDDKLYFSSLDGDVLLKKGELNIEGFDDSIYIDSLYLDFSDNNQLNISLSSLYNNEELTSVVLVDNFKNYINGNSSTILSSAKVSLSRYVINGDNNGGVSRQNKITLPDFIYSKVDFSVNEVVYSTASVFDFKLKAKISPNRIDIPNYHFNIFNGEVEGSAKINQSSVVVHAEAAELNFQTLFKAFNDFDQNNIQSEHITGLCDLLIDTKFPINSNNIENDLIVEGNFSIKEGSLVNVPIVNNVVQYLDENLVTKSVLDMKRLKLVSKNISFNEIHNSFTINNGELVIPDFTINSSVLDVNLDGVQKLSGYFRYNMNFRLAEIVNDSQDDYEFGIVEDDGTGMRIFMKIFGTSEDINFEMDKEAKKDFSKKNSKNEKKELKEIIKSELPFLKKNKKRQDSEVIQKSSSDNIEFQIEEDETDIRDEVIDDGGLIESSEDAVQFEIEE